MSQYQPTDMELKVRSLVLEVLEDPPQVIYGNQRKPTPDSPYVTINEIDDRLRGLRTHVTVVDEQNDTCTAVHEQQREADISITAVCQESVDIVKRVEIGLRRPEIKAYARSNNFAIGTQGETNTFYEPKSATRERRTVTTITFPYVRKETYEVGSIEEIEATGNLDDHQIVINKQL